jgi:hypothetical protein
MGAMSKTVKVFSLKLGLHQWDTIPDLDEKIRFHPDLDLDIIHSSKRLDGGVLSFW